MTRKQNEFKYLLLLLKYMGVDILRKGHHSSFFFVYVIPLCFNLIFVERIVYISVLFITLPAMMKVLLSAFTNCFVSLCTWCYLYFGRKRLKILLSRLLKVSSCFLPAKEDEKKPLFLGYVCFMTLFIAIYPIFYGIVECIVLLKIPKYKLYVWVIDKKSPIYTAILVLRGALSSVYKDTFCGVFCLLYCLFWWKVSRSLVYHRQLWHRILKEKNSILCFGNIFSRYTMVLNLVEDANSYFSNLIFLLILTNGLDLFNLMGLVISGRHAFSAYNIFKITAISVTSLTFLFLTITTGAQVTLEIERNINHLLRFKVKLSDTSQTFKMDDYQRKMLNEIIKRPVRSLTGCHMIFLKRSLITSMVGTLLTYGLLVLNLK